MAVNARTGPQRRASDPSGHAWVSASAGTGKTQVLTDRILRLLLAGTRPDHILALTFTRAAAAEMQNRLTRRLAAWIALDDAALQAELRLLDAPTQPATMQRARSLFADVLEVPGGLRVQTLHGFAQSLLAGFPVEAGLVPGFAVIDERQTARLRRRAFAELIAAAGRDQDERLLADIADMAVDVGENGVFRALDRLLGADAAFAAHRSADGFEPGVRRLLGIGAEGSIDAAMAALLAPDASRDPLLEGFVRCMNGWNTATGAGAAAAVRGWLDCDVPGRIDGFDRLCQTMMTAKGEPRSYKNAAKKFPELNDIIDEICAFIRRVDEERARYGCAAHAARHLRVGWAYAARYRAIKAAELVIDYDDMITRTVALLGGPAMPSWVAWKLDQRIEHILVDEAQDTNAAQWTIIDRLSEEFFAGDDRRRRSLFVVGDYKQAIFGFQGTDPRLFEAAQEAVRHRAHAAGVRFDIVPLDRSFRSGPAVLGFVDAVLDHLGPEALGLHERPPHHLAHRADAPGEVVIWPLIDEHTGDGEAATGTAEEMLARRMADVLSAQIAAWLRVGDPERLWLPAHGRYAQPGDILVLVRRRSSLMRRIVGALHRRGVHVAGVDRLLLSEPYAVLDLVALMRFAVQPEDDLNLAALLVSPLFGWDHEAVRRLAQPRSHSLWRALREAAARGAEAAADAVHWLGEALADADRSTPYRFLDTLLSGPFGARRRLYGRLGTEAAQPIDELLTQALAFERMATPSIETFLAWLDGDGGEIRRDPDASAGEVRLMTIHGAKGLEAPVVVVADAGRKPAQRRGPAAFPARLPGDAEPVPIFVPSVKTLPQPLEKLRHEQGVLQAQEDCRLLYVALTRAADHLYITGAVARDARASLADEQPPRWWQRLHTVIAALPGAETVAAPLWGDGETALRLRRGDWAVRAAPDLAPAPGAHPHWAGLALGPAPAVGRGTRPLIPSAPDAAASDGPTPAGRRARAARGQMIHRLFQQLPRVEPGRRRAVAQGWAERRGADDAPALADEVLAVIDHPGLAGLFGPAALAEAPVAGLVDGQVISGTVDRLLVEDGRILVADFKTDAAVPADAAAVPAAHRRQMEAYRAVLARAFPGRAVSCVLIYTAGPALLWL
jgi:ATP-dependent helicase/nuclease subunit A